MPLKEKSPLMVPDPTLVWAKTGERREKRRREKRRRGMRFEV